MRERRTRAVQEVTRWKEERKTRRREDKEAGGDRKGCDHSQDEQDETDPVWDIESDMNSNTPENTHARTR